MRLDLQKYLLEMQALDCLAYSPLSDVVIYLENIEINNCQKTLEWKEMVDFWTRYAKPNADKASRCILMK